VQAYICVSSVICVADRYRAWGNETIPS